MCNMWADSYNAVAPPRRRSREYILVASAVREIQEMGQGPRLGYIRMLSSYGTTFNRDFDAEDEDGDQMPVISVFTRDKKGVIRHFYSKCAMLDEKNFRGIDLLSPVWNLFDLLPSGRKDWLPKYAY